MAVASNGLAILLHLFFGRHRFRQQAHHQVVALIKGQLNVGSLVHQVDNLVVLYDGVRMFDSLEVMHQRIEVVPLLYL